MSFILFRSIVEAYGKGEITRERFIAEWRLAQLELGTIPGSRPA